MAFKLPAKFSSRKPLLPIAFEIGDRSLQYQKGGVDLFTDYAWTYDKIHRITQFTSQDGTSAFTYDATSQLTATDHSYQTDETHSYDSTGNRTNTGYTTGTNNRLTADGTYNYDYDDEGNRTKRTHTSSGAVTEYTWDHRNRLIAVVERSSATGPIIKSVDYTYDVFDRRICKSIDADGAGSGTVSATSFVYDGDHIALEFNNSGNLSHRYLHGPVVDQILADEQVTSLSTPGAVLWPLADNQGTVRDLVNSSGVVQNHLKYDSFGKITAESNAAVDHLFAYTGRERDEETGLFYYRARYYDADTGRFISEDPIGFLAGDPNLSRYVPNDPANGIDPSGLEEVNDADYVAAGGVPSPFTTTGYTPGAEPQIGAIPALAPKLAQKIGIPPWLAGAAVGLKIANHAPELGNQEMRRPRPPRIDDPPDPNPVGTAVIYQHPGRPYHVSVEVIYVGWHLQTHQDVSKDEQHTWIVTAQSKPPGSIIGTPVILPLANAQAAMIYSMKISAGSKGPDLGPYNQITNSCVSYVCQVLYVGKSVPLPPLPGGSNQAKYMYKQGIKKPKLGPPPPPTFPYVSGTD